MGEIKYKNVVNIVMINIVTVKISNTIKQPSITLITQEAMPIKE